MKTPEPRFQIGKLEVRVNIGEILFPLLVLCFCTAYYFDTQNLPDQSMLYAGPLLYVTAAIAVVTVGGQAVSVNRNGNSSAEPENNGLSSMAGWNAEKKIDSQATALVIGLLVIGYIGSLYLVPFIAATPLFLAGSLYILGERSITRIIVYSIGFTFVVWLVFVEWLLVPIA
jgi:hypothetical protein